MTKSDRIENNSSPKELEDFFNDIFSWEEISLLDKAYEIALDAHADQKRDEGTPT